MATPRQSFEAPFREPITEVGAFLSRAWEWFFRDVWERLYPLGIERSFQLENNKSAAADIVGMKFDARSVSAAYVEYLVQRITTGGSAIEKIEAGIFIVAYEPVSEHWELNAVLADKPTDSGVTFSITEGGQVQYTSTNEAGTKSISRITWRARTISAKHSSYSTVGSR